MFRWLLTETAQPSGKRRLADSNRCNIPLASEHPSRYRPEWRLVTPLETAIVTSVELGASPSTDPQPSARGLAPNPIRWLYVFVLELLDPGSHEVSF